MFKLHLHFVLSSITLISIPLNLYYLGSSLSIDSRYSPWRSILTPESESEPETTGWSELRDSYKYLSNQTGSHVQYEYDPETDNDVKLLPNLFDSSALECFDSSESTSDIQNVVLPSIIPTLTLVLVMIMYKYYSSRLWRWEYGSFGHVSSSNCVTSQSGYKMLSVLLLMSTVCTIIFVYLPKAEWTFSTAYIMFLSGGNLGIAFLYVKPSSKSYNLRLLNNSDANAKTKTKQVNDVVIGSFGITSNASKVVSEVEYGLVQMLSCGDSSVLMEECLITQEGVDALTKGFIGNIDIVRVKSVMDVVSSFFGRSRNSTNKQMSKIQSKRKKSHSRSSNFCASLLAFAINQSPYLIIIFNVFDLLYYINLQEVTDDYSFPSSQAQEDMASSCTTNENCDTVLLNYTSSEGQVQSINIKPFQLRECIQTKHIIGNFLGSSFGGHDSSDGILTFILLAFTMLILSAVIVIYVKSKVRRKKYGTLDYLKSQNNAPRAANYRRSVRFLMVLSFAIGGYSVFLSNEDCAVFDDGDCALNVNVDVRRVYVSFIAVVNLIIILKGRILSNTTPSDTLPRKSKRKRRRKGKGKDKDRNELIVPLSTFSSASDRYDEVNTSMLMYYATSNNDSVMLEETLGIDEEEIDNAISSLKMNYTVYSTAMGVGVDGDGEGDEISDTEAHDSDSGISDGDVNVNVDGEDENEKDNVNINEKASSSSASTSRKGRGKKERVKPKQHTIVNTVVSGMCCCCSTYGEDEVRDVEIGITLKEALQEKEEKEEEVEAVKEEENESERENNDAADHNDDKDDNNPSP